MQPEVVLRKGEGKIGLPSVTREMLSYFRPISPLGNLFHCRSLVLFFSVD